jgi:hypothetical protein
MTSWPAHGMGDGGGVTHHTHARTAVTMSDSDGRNTWFAPGQVRVARSATSAASIAMTAVVLVALGASCTSPPSPAARGPTDRRPTATPSHPPATATGKRPTGDRQSMATGTATREPSKAPVTPTLLPPTMRASAGRMPIGIDEGDAGRAALEMVAGGSDARVEWFTLMSGRQWQAVATSEPEYQLCANYCGWLAYFPAETPIYIVAVSALYPPEPADDSAHPEPRRRTRIVAIDAQDGGVLWKDPLLTDAMAANVRRITPPAPMRPPQPDRFAVLRKRATPTPEPPIIGPWWTPESTSEPSGISHSATLAEVVQATAWRQGARWTYAYVADEMLPPRLVTHTILSMVIVAPEAAVLHIGTEGEPAFMPDWLLVDHGNVFVGTPQTARAWLQGRVATPTGQEPYVRLPPPSKPIGWNYDASSGFSMTPCSAAPTYYDLADACRSPSGHLCSQLFIGAFFGGTHEVICPGIGWASRDVDTRYGSERWTLIRFDPGPGADPGARATAAAFLGTATPTRPAAPAPGQ